MDIDLDLDDFIANIEGTAPKEELDDNNPRCKGCDTVLEEVEGEFICPQCNIQATDILQLEETEMQYTEAGRAIHGARVSLKERRKKHIIDYGWAWSTDEAIVYILSLQVKALKKLGVVDDSFCKGIKNMWCKFWIENIAPFIKDEFVEGDLIPITVRKALKLRDIEILFKVKNKVMVPMKSNQGELKHRPHRMLGTQFSRSMSEEMSNPDDIFSDDHSDNVLTAINEDIEMETDLLVEDQEEKPANTLTKKCNYDSVSILTLNRTLAFIDATARCIDMPEPLFASDIVRACSQRMIPFFGVHKTLPKDMKINPRDRLMFQKNRSPSPRELALASSRLLRKIYHDQLPFRLPVPKLYNILKRYIVDLNLPCDLLNYVNDHVSFDSFRNTTYGMKFDEDKFSRIIPQFDKLAYAILMSHLKRLFIFDDRGIRELSDQTREQSKVAQENLFIIGDWVRQMNIKLQLILAYDPYSLLHPLTDINNLCPTAQTYQYIDTLLAGKVVLATTRTAPNERPIRDESFCAELTDFLKREIPRPPQVADEDELDEKLEKPTDLFHPIRDAFARTKRFWFPEISKDGEIADLLFQDYHDQKILLVKHNQTWVYPDGIGPCSTNRLPPEWPECFKLLLRLGGYLCYCNPKELLVDFKRVEKHLHGRKRKR